MLGINAAVNLSRVVINGRFFLIHDSIVKSYELPNFSQLFYHLKQTTSGLDNGWLLIWHQAIF